MKKNKMKICTQIIVALVMVMLSLTNTNARPITYYQHFTVQDQNLNGLGYHRTNWFWTPDTLWGPVRSNSIIALRYRPTFYSWVITSAPEFREDNADPHFERDPVFNAPELDFPAQYPHLRDRAHVRVDGNDGELITRIHLRRNVIDIYQYRAGLPVELDFLSSYQHWYRQILFIDGKAEIYGELQGTLTIYASDDIYLIDDIKYVHSDRNGRWPDNRDPGGMLGIVSEGDIIIQDNWANGKSNSGRGNSIIINASLVALGGSFTFEHQNNNWEQYQGPEPDERGYIYLKGGVAQRTRGPVHTSNHTGTGYGKAYQWDRRLETTGPPGFAAGEYPDIEGQYDYLSLYWGTYYIKNATVNHLWVYPGVELVLEDNNSLTVHGDIEMNGAEVSPITVRPRNDNERVTFRGDWGGNPKMNLNYVIFMDGVSVDLDSDTIKVTNCSFAGEVSFEGNVYLDSSVFNGEVIITSFDDIIATRNVFTEGVTIEGNVADGRFLNNTLVGASAAGLLIRRFRSLRVENNIFAFNRWGIVNRDRDNPVLAYNDVFANRHYDYVNCEAGEESISVDPRFVNIDEGDYNLVWNSPCVDAGDPNSPNDPDGSRADMGALAIDHELAVADEAIMPNEFSVSVFPNPFNDVVKIQISSSIIGVAEWSVFDIHGRVALTGKSNFSGGTATIKIQSKQLSTSGVYLLKMNLADQTAMVKLVYLR